jgi:hypothetical protein
MPPIRKKCTPEDARIINAIEALDNGDCGSVSEAARGFTVPYRKLLRRYQNRENSTIHGGHNKTLDDAQEQALLVYIQRCYTAGKAVRQHHTKPLAAERKAAIQKGEIETHFAKFIARYHKLKIQPSNLWNCNETGFRIRYLCSQTVFTISDKSVYQADPDNRKLITAFECISAAGCWSDPMIIIAGVLFKEKHFNNNLLPTILLAISESGYTNDNLSFEWLVHWEKQTRPLENE